MCVCVHLVCLSPVCNACCLVVRTQEKREEEGREEGGRKEEEEEEEEERKQSRKVKFFKRDFCSVVYFLFFPLLLFSLFFCYPFSCPFLHSPLRPCFLLSF